MAETKKRLIMPRVDFISILVSLKATNKHKIHRIDCQSKN